MTDLDEQHIAERILAAPGWARLGITEPRPELRAAAAGELARAILAQARPHPAPPGRPPLSRMTPATPQCLDSR